MPRQKIRELRSKWRPESYDALERVAASLKLDRSNTLRFLVTEKAMELGLLPSVEPSATSASGKAAPSGPGSLDDGDAPRAGRGRRR